METILVRCYYNPVKIPMAFQGIILFSLKLMIIRPLRVILCCRDNEL